MNICCAPPKIITRCYAVKVRSRGEEAVANALQTKGYEVLLPCFSTLRHYSDRVRKVKCALFPGYVFVRMNPENLLSLVTTEGVSYVVRSGSGMLPLSEEETRTIEALCRVNETQKLEPHSYLRIGEKVRIEAGPMTGLEGILVRVRDMDRVVITVETLHSSVSVELGHTAFRVLEPSQDGAHSSRMVAM
jgi:transcription antitermination factor NusG